MPIRSVHGRLAWLVAGALLAVRPAHAETAAATLTAARGDVTVRAPKERSYGKAAAGMALADRARLRTGDGAEAKLRFPDGSEVVVHPQSEVLVHPPAHGEGAGGRAPGSVMLFFGRVWSKIAKSQGAGNSFEVRSANAVAGVRGTQFEVGVAQDGSTRVVVREGSVAVSGDEDESKAMPVGADEEVEANGEGKLQGRKKCGADPDWDGWFSKRARELEKRGLKIAHDLDGRLNTRKAKLEKLVAEQRTLREKIEALEAKKREGEDVEGALRESLAELERVTARLRDMKARLVCAFGIFERWGAIARGGGMEGAGEVQKLASGVAKMAADFADMIEEGTDQSEEGMDDMMKDMHEHKSGRPKKGSVKDELF